MPGLYIQPNDTFGFQLGTQQFTTQVLTIQDRNPQNLSGASWHDTVTFSFERFLYEHISPFWENVFAQGGVTQRRLVSGDVILYPAKYPCTICRVCWDVMDKRTGELFQETATGLVSITQAEVAYFSESWQMTLYRGDYYLNELGQLEASTRGCGG